MPGRRCLRAAMVTLAAGILLAGCSHVPVTSMITLAKVDFETTDPAQLRAAVKMPAGIRPRTATLRIAVAVAGGPAETQDFRLERIADPSELAALREETETGTHIVAYRLEPGEAARLVAFRETLKAKQKQAANSGRGGTLSISISSKGCRMGELPPKVLLTTYLRTTETRTYIPLARDVDLRSLTAARDLAAEIPPCD